MIDISSFSNQRIKNIIKLRKKRERDKSDNFLIEGYRELSRAFQNDIKIKDLFFCRDLFLGENEDALIDNIKNFGVNIFSCSKSVFEKISYRDRPDGLLAVANKFCTDYKKINTNGIIIVAESIEKPGNLGTILRTADGVGASGVIICDECTDVFNPNVVRASVGTMFKMKIGVGSSKDVISWLKDNFVTIISTTPGGNIPYYDLNMKGNVAIVLGTEQYGLSKLWLDNSDINTFIPMSGVADSLNVSMAATVVLYEAYRQKNI